VLVSIDELRQQVRRRRTVREPRPDSAAAGREAVIFRPAHRPPMAILYVLDDGAESQEAIRIRDDSFVIGRTEGNLTISHDGAISGRHAELSRRICHGQYVWFLKDLESSNGTFARIRSAALQNDEEFLMGSRRFRYRVVTPPSATVSGAGRAATRKWQEDSPAEAPAASIPALVEMAERGVGREFALQGDEHWFGSDPGHCSLVVEDSLICPRHARLYRDAGSQWHIEDAKSANGVWIRISEIALGKGGHFLCGEQRFMFKVP
jgi:pSer/pThr/pTyr-binding forkhead associated (FHA) protein